MQWDSLTVRQQINNELLYEVWDFKNSESSSRRAVTRSARFIKTLMITAVIMSAGLRATMMDRPAPLCSLSRPPPHSSTQLLRIMMHTGLIHNLHTHTHTVRAAFLLYSLSNEQQPDGIISHNDRFSGVTETFLTFSHHQTEAPRRKPWNTSYTVQNSIKNLSHLRFSAKPSWATDRLVTFEPVQSKNELCHHCRKWCKHQNTQSTDNLSDFSFIRSSVVQYRRDGFNLNKHRKPTADPE